MTMRTYDVKVAANGRMVLPASVRAALGLEGESRVTLTVEGEGVSLRPMALHVASAQAPATRRAGSGLGDRSCMALAIAAGAPALTADRTWTRVAAEGLTVALIR